MKYNFILLCSLVIYNYLILKYLSKQIYLFLLILKYFLGSISKKKNCNYTCPNKSCNKIYKSKGSYFNHVNYECGGRKQFECWLCNKKFSQKDLLSEYRRQSNLSISYKFTCPNCCRRYSHKPRLVHHLKHECGYKRFICNICYRTFGRKDHLKNHVICVHKMIANT